MLYYVSCFFVFCSPFRRFCAGFCSAGSTLFWRLKSADFVGPDSLFFAIRICLSSIFYLTNSEFSFGFLPCKTTKTGSRARIVGFCQFQNLSIGKIHKVFLHPSGVSALNFHTQNPLKKILFLKSHEKALFCIAVSGHAAPQKHVLCLFCRAARHQTEPSGDTMNRTTWKGVMQIQAVTADVTLANNVNCWGNMCQT